jgi:hypothetical protein
LKPRRDLFLPPNLFLKFRSLEYECSSVFPACESPGMPVE